MNQSEFEHIVGKARAQALAVSRGFGIDGVGAEDVAQDTLLRLWTLHDELAADCNIEALATVVARHLAIDSLRRHRKTIDINTQWNLADEVHASPSDVAENADNTEWLEKKLRQLPSTEYQVIHLREVEGKTNQEMAALLGITEASVATLLSRARKKLLNDIKRRLKI